MSKTGSQIILWAFIVYFAFCQVLFNRYIKMNDKLSAAMHNVLKACTNSHIRSKENDKYK